MLPETLLRAPPKAAEASPSLPIENCSLDSASVDVLASLRRRGFDLLSHVRSKAAEDLWEIKGILTAADSKQYVQLIALPHRHMSRKLDVQRFFDTMRKPSPGYENKLLHKWPDLPRGCVSTGSTKTEEFGK